MSYKMDLDVGTVRFVTETCCSCGVLFAMTSQLQRERLADKALFYCPNGHNQHYLGVSNHDRIRQLEASLTSAQDQRRAAEGHRLAAERKATRARADARRLKQRASGGACPCCNRSFVQLARHMKAKHPEFIDAAG